jgi:hypothetical protein
MTAPQLTPTCDMYGLILMGSGRSDGLWSGFPGADG